jgi:hypothetical protein
VASGLTDYKSTNEVRAADGQEDPIDEGLAEYRGWTKKDLQSAYTVEMLEEDDKPKKGGPQRLSDTQVTILRAVGKAVRQEKPTAQVKQAAGSCEPTIQAPTSSRPPAPRASETNPPAAPKVPKKKKSGSGPRR